ncbi:hypothetical protein BJ322DRAFT_492887 [Thelephora terrestris]|uniref:Secreted protein n=1 Tax=Thelephora terrestris TaxID=56493 RepID=A0A9P6L0T5_9AGAM|nr:hypothetical protein BJ322DRAFT_492887 [Thelephora terrestris]
MHVCTCILALMFLCASKPEGGLGWKSTKLSRYRLLGAWNSEDKPHVMTLNCQPLATTTVHNNHRCIYEARRGSWAMPLVGATMSNKTCSTCCVSTAMTLILGTAGTHTSSSHGFKVTRPKGQFSREQDRRAGEEICWPQRRPRP